MTKFDGPILDHWLELKVAQTENASTMQGRSTMQEDPKLYNRVLYDLIYIPPLGSWSAILLISIRLHILILE